MVPRAFTSHQRRQMSPYFYGLMGGLITAAGVYIAHRKGWIE